MVEVFDQASEGNKACGQAILRQWMVVLRQGEVDSDNDGNNSLAWPFLATVWSLSAKSRNLEQRRMKELMAPATSMVDQS